MSSALICAGASAEIGGGHIRRCLVLAEALRAADWTCTFAVAPGSAAIVPQLVRSGHKVIEISSREQDMRRAAIGHGGFDLAVVDHYGLDAVFERRCRNFANRVLVVDDLANRPHECDILLDPTLGRTEKEYRPLLSGAADLLLGPAYALLESRFFTRRLMLPAFKQSVSRAFISFGAVDPFDFSSKTIAALRKIGAPMQIDVAVGSASPNIDALRDFADDDVLPARIVVDGQDIPALMAAADIAIGAGGGTGWERCCLGLPSLIVTVADNQRENAAALHDAGAARWLGDACSVSPDRLAAGVMSLVADQSGRAAMRAAARAITDGLGANRMVSAVEGAPTAHDGRPVTLRRAGADDCDKMFAWQSESGARRYARNSLPPRYDEHCEWFRGKLSDPHCVLSVVLHDGRPAGVLRYDWHTRARSFEVSILVSSERQGRGIGAAALALGRQLLPGVSVVADVDPANGASVALFEKASYRRAGGRRFILSPTDPPRSDNAVRTRASEDLH